MAKATTTARNLDSATTSVHKAISALHGLRWASQYAQDEQSHDAFMCLVDALLPSIGAELEAAHTAMGGVPAGYFSSNDVEVSRD